MHIQHKSSFEPKALIEKFSADTENKTGIVATPVGFANCCNWKAEDNPKQQYMEQSIQEWTM